MNTRAKELLIYILSLGDYVSIDDLADQFNYSNRTIYSYLSDIDFFLESEGFNVLDRKKNLGIKAFYSKSEKEKILRLITLDSLSSHSPMNRCRRIIHHLLSYDEYITIDDLSEINEVSRNTTLSDIQTIDSFIKGSNLTIVSSPFKGIKIVGNEMDKRKILLETYTLDLNNPDLEVDLILSNLMSNKEIDSIEKVINRLEQYTDNSLSGIAYKNAKTNLAMSVNRIRNGHEIKELHLPVEIENTKEYHALLSMKSTINELFEVDLPESEIRYIAVQLVGSSVQTNNYGEDITELWFPLQMTVQELIANVENDLQISLMHDEQLFNGLMIHMRPAYYRLLNGKSQDNPLLYEIEKNYKTINDVVIKNLIKVEKSLDLEFTRDEASYITMYFAAAIERNRNVYFIRPKVVIVCDSGISTSQILKSQIEQRFEFEVVEVLDLRSLDDFLEDNEVDYIITTINFSRKNYNILQVNPILSDDDINDLNKISRKLRKELDIDELYSIISSHAIVENEQSLKMALFDYLSPALEHKVKEETERIFMLKDVLTTNLVSVNANVNNRDEAIKKCGELLLEAGLIEERYIDAMIENVEKNGSYIVIAPGIAIPHARPEEGALGIGLSIVTLAEPVVFGHKLNDPVKIVVGLCAIDHHSHLEALSELVEILGDQNKLNRMLDAKSSQELMKIVKEGNK